jgi:hypothetical protein
LALTFPIQVLLSCQCNFSFLFIFCHSPCFFTFPAGPSALLALGVASGSHDAPRAGAGKVIVMGHERKISFATREPEGNPSGENIYSLVSVSQFDATRRNLV